MNGAETFLYYDEIGDKFMQEILRLEWSLEFT